MKAQIRLGHRPTLNAESPTLNPQRGTPGVERLSVYAGGYLVRLEEALTEVYEAIRHIVGATAFTELSRAYAVSSPSHDYNLSFIGRHLPEWLERSPLRAELPFLPDLARLEWLVCQAFHAFEEPPLDPRRLSQLSLEDWERARLVFQPSVGLAASAWPILDLWAARTRPRAEINLDLVNRPQRVLVFRQGVQVRGELVDERRYALLQGLLAGRPLGSVCGELAGGAGEEPLPLTEWFARWARQGLIVRCDVSGAFTPGSGVW